MNLMHHTAILWRGPGSVQIGGDRARHVRLDDLHASDQLWLASQARPAHASDAPEASPDLLAALAEADLVDHPDCRPLLSVGVLGAVPATVLALRSLVDTLALRLRIDAPTLVDGDWDHVFGGVYTGTTRSRAVRRELASLIPLPDLHAQDTPDVALVSADRALDPGIPFELMAADTPHLLITRGEHSYEIGPFVIPGSTPCCCVTSPRGHSPHHCVPRSPRSTRTEPSASNARSAPTNVSAASTAWPASSGPFVDDDLFATHQCEHRGGKALHLHVTDASNHTQLRRVLWHGLGDVAQGLVGKHGERRHARLT